MWVEELKNGKYKFVERYTDPMTGKLNNLCSNEPPVRQA